MLEAETEGLGVASMKKTTKVLIAGALVMGMMGASLIAPSPAHASTTFSVSLSDDRADANPGDGQCSVVTFGAFCTLRASIQEANATPGADTINLNIGTATDGLATISPGSALPNTTDAVTIDGYYQPLSSPNTLAQGTNAALKVKLDGTNAGSEVDGLSIDAGGSGSVIKGLVINNIRGDGVSMKNGSTQNRIEGSFIGTDPSGTTAQHNNGSGVDVVGSSFNTIGGQSPATRNLISGNGSQGVFLHGGVNAASNNTVQGNLIGTKKDESFALGNHSKGVFIAASSNNSVSANTIAVNGTDGVGINFAGTSKGNLFAGKSIFSNTDLGIDLDDDGVTPNDSLDADTGANDLQNFPVLSSAKTSKKGTTIKGTLNSTPNKSFLVQFFSNASGRDEGQKFIGQVGVTTDSGGNASFSFKSAQKVSKGKITATAIDSASKNTSEFSVAKKVV